MMWEKKYSAYIRSIQKELNLTHKAFWHFIGLQFTQLQNLDL